MIDEHASPWPADKVERRHVAELVPYACNARTHSAEQVDQLVASIKEWGWTSPVLLDEDGGIIAGHGRVLTAKKLGLDVPCMVAVGWTEAQRKAYVIADNKLALGADWDEAILKTEFATAIGDFGEVVLPKVAQGFRQVVDHETVMVGEEVVAHLRDFPSRQIEVQAIDEGHVEGGVRRDFLDDVALAGAPSTSYVRWPLISIASDPLWGSASSRWLAPEIASRADLGSTQSQRWLVVYQGHVRLHISRV
jgi:hypothetical protein